eukprot:g11408.t1
MWICIFSSFQPRKSILPKTGKLNRNALSAADSRALLATIGVTGEQELRKCGGASLLVKIAEQKPSEIRLRDILVYVVLGLMWGYLSWSGGRWPGYAYAFTDDLRRVLKHEDFYKVNTTAQGLIWWQRSYARFLSPPFSEFNVGYGYLRMRQQKVEFSEMGASPSCPSFVAQLGETILGARNCTDDSKTERGLVSPELEQYWLRPDAAGRTKVGNYGRGVSLPYAYGYADGDGSLNALTAGSGRSYSGDGYSVDYNLLADNPAEVAVSIEEDVVAFSEFRWLDERTRLITWSVTVYNAHYDLETTQRCVPLSGLFASVDYILETPPGGRALPTIHVLPFRPNTKETGKESTEAVTFHVRLLCALYILAGVIPMEIAARERVYKAGGKYLITLLGIADQVIVLCTITAYFWQLVSFGQELTVDVMRPGKAAFRHFSDYGERYRQAFELDGVMLMFLSLRLSRYLTLSRRIYLLWRALDRITKRFAFVLGVTLLLLVFWTYVGMLLLGRMYGDPHFQDLRTSFLSVFRLFRGDGNFL